jgi:anti-sigma regulatory factor (Ser/Thr protein kinase)
MRTGVPAGCVGNFHEAGFYASDTEFLRLIVPFVTSGLAVGEPVVIGYDARKCALIRSAVAGREQVTFIEDSSLYATPARAIEAYREQFERHVAAGAEQIRIAGDVPHEGNGGRFDGWDRYESAVNVVWQDYPVYSRCLYDATTVSNGVRDVVERTHRFLITAQGASGSPRYQEPTEFRSRRPAADPLELTAPILQLADASLKRTSRRVADAARDRIDDATRGDLLFALSEVMINAQLYGRPPITVRAWTSPDRVVVQVHDAGDGPPDPLSGLIPAPEGAGGGGLGLWLVHQLTTIDVALIGGADGFTVRLRAGRVPTAADAAPVPVSLRVGTSRGLTAGIGSCHVIDGDGASFCGIVQAADLDPVDGASWSDLAPNLQCPHCLLFLGHDG